MQLYGFSGMSISELQNFSFEAAKDTASYKKLTCLWFRRKY